LWITASRKGEVTQDDTTSHLIKSFLEPIAYVSTFMTLKPSDIVAAGRPVNPKCSEPLLRLRAGAMPEAGCSAAGIMLNKVAQEL
jgi:2-keto-4-pentenoate hydratase/2-oxohepta-3-ene-1,7-dioic acid hydratase in catechol pathway